MPLLGQTKPVAPVAPPAQTAPKAQTAIIGAGSGGMYIFNSKHEVAAFCAKLEGKVVSDCKVQPGHTVTEAIQGLLDTLIH